MTESVLAFGEVLWDLLPDGPVLGGAPFYFAHRISEMGRQGNMISAIGRDELGLQALDEIVRLGLSPSHIQISDAFPTGTVAVQFDDTGQPDYEIIREVAYDHIAYTDAMDQAARNCRCVCYGTLAQRSETSRKTLQHVLDRVIQSGVTYRVLDINLRKDCYSPETITSSLYRATILKLNDQEARTLAVTTGLASTNLIEIGRLLVGKWSLLHCVITLGEQGALVISGTEPDFYDPGYAIHFVDPLGSGDAFTAGFVSALLDRRSAQDACRIGNVLGTLTATHRGATAPISDREISEFLQTPPGRIRLSAMESATPNELGTLKWKI